MSNNKDLDEFVRNLFGGNKKKPVDVTPVDESDSESPQSKKTIVPKNKKPINMKQWTAAITTAGIILVVLLVALANVYIVKENEYRIVRQDICDPLLCIRNASRGNRHPRARASA